MGHSGLREPVLMATGPDEKARGEVLDKMVRLRERKQIAEAKSCKDSSTPNEKSDNKKLALKVMIKFRLKLQYS